MLIAGASLWVAATNTYVVAPAAGEVAVVVDAPPDPTAIVDLLLRHRLTVGALVLTHGHIDHMGGAAELQRRTDAVAWVHPDDDFLTLHPAEQLRLLFGMTPPGPWDPPIDPRPLDDGATLTVGDVTLDVLHTPGHTPGHCCFHLADEGVLFSGDQLFAGSIGRTDLPGGDLPTLLTSMREKVLVLDDDTVVYPGHGPATTIGRERRTNPFLQGLR